VRASLAPAHHSLPPVPQPGHVCPLELSTREICSSFLDKTLYQSNSPGRVTSLAQPTMLLQRLLLLCSILVAAVNASGTNRENHEVAIGWDTFRSLVGDTDEPPIHSILNPLSPKDKNGKDKEVKHIHSEDAPQATSFLKLAKRYAYTNSSITTPTFIPGTGGTAPSKTKTPYTPTKTPYTPTTKTPHTPKTKTPYTPKATSPEPLSSIVLTTYTLPNGQVTTRTSLIIVNTPTTPPAVPRASSSSEPAPIQTGSVGSTNGFAKEMVMMLGGAVAFALVL
jgi:hypothetical protein